MNIRTSVVPFMENPTWGDSNNWGNAYLTDVMFFNSRKQACLYEIDKPVSERGKLYESFSYLLSTGLHDKLILYIPFSLIPTIEEYKEHRMVFDHFMDLYFDCFNRLLEIQDVRADFIDGDVLDFGADNEKVIQAAFLIPILEQKGWIKKSTYDDYPEMLKKSIKYAYDPKSTCKYLKERYTVRSKPTDSKSRKQWLKWESDKLKAEVEGDRFTTDYGYQDFLDGPASSNPIGTANAIGKYVDEFADRINSAIRQLTGNPMSDSLMSVLLRMISKKQLHGGIKLKFGISYPSFIKTYKNLENYQQYLDDVWSTFEETSVLYPVFVVYGSRLKGYGRYNSDFDLAVFVKPDACDYEVKEELSKFANKPYVFYLENNNDKLEILDCGDIANVGSPMDIHIILNGSFQGDCDTINMLRNKLIKPFFDQNNHMLNKFWIQILERDMLLYRLLHRGYSQIFEPKHDWVFMDEGYRTLATKLYMSHVHLFDVNYA